MAHESTHHYQSNPFLVTITGLLEILKNNPIPALLLSFVIAAMYVAVVVVGLLFLYALPLLGGLLIAAGSLFVAGLGIGSAAVLGVSSMHGKKYETMEMIKIAQPKVLPALGAVIVVATLVGLGLVFFIIPGLIFLGWWSMTFVAMFDEDLGVFAAMKRSKELAKGHVVEVLGALVAGSFLSGGLLGLATGVAPLIGRYQQLKALKASGHAKPQVHWLNYILPVLAVLFAIAYVASIAATADQNQNPKVNDTYFNSY